MNSTDLLRLCEESTAHARTAGLRHAFQRPAVREVVRLIESGGVTRAVLLEGPRQVGKSTLLHQLLAGWGHGAAWYVDFEDPRLRGVGLRDVCSAVAAGREGEPPALVLFDEVHHVREWASELKRLVDERTAVFAAADSAAAVLAEDARQAGVGRWSTSSVRPLDFSEWLDLLGASGMAPAHSAYARYAACDEFLRRGGFPGFAALQSITDVHRHLREDAAVQAIRRDIGPRHGLRDVAGLEGMLTRLLETSGSELNQASASETAEVSLPTGRHWLRALLDTALVWSLEVHARSATKRGRRPTKIYAVDSGLVAAFAIGGASSSEPAFVGRLVETACANGLRGWAHRAGAKLGYDRDDRGEADFVVELPSGERAVLEATASRHPEKKVPSLAKRAARLSARWCGVVTPTLAPTHHSSGGQVVHIVALHTLLEALGRGESVEAWGWR